MFTLDGYSISITKGDTGTVTVTMTGDLPPDGTVALISLKVYPGNSYPLWEKRVNISDGAFSFDLEHRDTDLQPMRYWWDIRLLYENGLVFTPMSPAPFNILEVVGNA